MKMPKSFPPVIIILLVACAIGVATFIVGQPPLSNTNPTPCAQEAKVCPDGSTVGRTGPHCTFADCPEPQRLNLYENEYFQVQMPDGWNASEATQTVYDGNVETHPLNPAAVNIRKGKYILYINAHMQQASGVEGGRYAEIAMGAPSADAVVIYQPSEPCGTSEKSPVLMDHQRVDWFVSKRDAKEWCATPKDDSTRWYFSYVTHTGGYINYYTPDTPPGYVITMAYDSKDIAALPKKESVELQQALSDMSRIVNTLVLKKKS